MFLSQQKDMVVGRDSDKDRKRREGKERGQWVGKGEGGRGRDPTRGAAHFFIRMLPAGSFFWKG